MKKGLFVAYLLLLPLWLMAAPIGEKRAREIAATFFALSTATRSSASPALSLAWSGSNIEQSAQSDNTSRTSLSETSDDALMYIYNRTDTTGFVIVAGDDNAERDIIAYSHDNSFDTEDMADGAKAILQAWCDDISFVRNNKSVKSTTRAPKYEGKIVREYETAKWGQGSPYNKECPLIDGNRAVTGCVATAAAIICYYHRWPEKAVGETEEYTISKNNTTVPAKVLGRTYDYDNMLMSYKNVSYTDEQAAAVAALMSDIGCSIRIQYGDDSTGGNILRLARELALKFGYSKEMVYLRRSSFEDSKWYEMLRNNLDTYGPTYYRGTSAGGSGHAFLLDGYTDADYFRINYGHTGSGDGYYFLPNITYLKDQRSIFNMYPDKDGTTQYRPWITVGANFSSNATKYEVGKSFTCELNIVNIGLISFSGQYGVAHCNKNGEIKSILATRQVSGSLSSGSTGSKRSFSCVITEAIQDNDCLQVVYKDKNDSEWKIAKRNSNTCIEKIVLSLPAEEIAKNIVLEIDKTTNVLSISSSYAMQCSITDISGRVVASSETKADETATFSLATLNANIYNCSFSVSGEPYTIKLKLHDNQSNGSFGLDGLGGYVDDTIF